MIPFTDVLRQAKNGVIAGIINDELTNLVKSVKQRRKSGTITITLKVEPDKHGTEEVYLKWDVATKLPKKDIPNSTAFATAEGDLLRDDPTQRDMFKDTSKEAQSAAVSA